jgi:type IV pilus assembly protein PilX
MNKDSKVTGQIRTFARGNPLPRRRAERGISLVMVMLILVVVSILGVGAAQIAIMGERSTRNDRDQQVAWQAAEAALIDAEFDMRDPAPATSRQTLFDAKNQVAFFSGCGTAASVTGGKSVGLCALNSSGKPAWLTADFTETSATATTTELGTFTGRSFASGGKGVQPAQRPRYVIEVMPDPVGDASNPTYIYRVTAMGFGPRTDIQAMLQMIYRI